jgi:sugar transferase (PEP-CTERM/EpsH1 system associated)
LRRREVCVAIAGKTRKHRGRRASIPAVVKVLFLCQRVPYPPDRGDRITTWHFLSHLHARGAELRLGCFREEPRDTDAIAALAQRCKEISAPRLDRRTRRVLALKGLLTGEPLTLPFFRHRRLQAAVSRWFATDPPDLVYVYSSSMAQYVVRKQGAVRCMQFAELDSEKWRQFAASATSRRSRWIYSREAELLLAFEAKIARAFDVSFVVSDTEQALFRQRIPGTTPIVLPNGVDVVHFASGGHDQRDPHTAIFTGVMDYQPNVDAVCWFAEQCWPRLREKFTDARFLVVGSSPTPAVLALAARPGIEVTGRVPTTPPWFDKAAVAIAPLRLARGVQNKVLEAMSMAVPVVASPAAAQGLDGLGPDTLIVAADADATVAAVSELFANPPMARAIGQRAAAWVRANYRWENMYAILDSVLAAHGLG